MSVISRGWVGGRVRGRLTYLWCRCVCVVVRVREKLAVADEIENKLPPGAGRRIDQVAEVLVRSEQDDKRYSNAQPPSTSILDVMSPSRYMIHISQLKQLFKGFQA